jgi:transcriptional regulator with XRE-family HTH domain
MADKGKANPIDIHVGSRVRLRRMILGMSQEKLGHGLGITFQQIQKYEKGTNRISASRLQHIAQILSVPIPFFFDDAPGESAVQPRGMEAKSNNNPLEFLSSAEGLQLNKAFVRIKDPKLRRTITNLVRALAGERETTG